MELAPLLAAHGGWKHRDDVLDLGWKPHQILAARHAEGIPLVRRKWLILPGAGYGTREAARVGGALTGVSALDRYELWKPPGLRDGRVHIGVAPDAHVDRGERTVLDRGRTVVARSPRSLIDPLPNVLANIARILPPVDAFAVWESAVTQKHATPEQIRGLPWRTETARSLAEQVSRLSDSGIESMFVANCRRARIPVVQQVRIAGRRVDALVGAHLVVQLDGYAFHSDAAQRRQDIAHDRQLALMGYTVLRYSYHDIVYDWPRVEREIRAAIAQGRAA
ncbi:MAG: endonuclease domain-containing protein [Microbacterium gubbeenense]